MDQQTADVLAELIQSQSALLRMVLVVGYSVPHDTLHDAMSPMAEQVTAHLERAVKVLNDA